MDEQSRAFRTLGADFARVAHLLAEASYELRRRKLSAYPLFVRCLEPPQLGVCLIASGEHGAQAHYHASSLEELTSAGFVEDKAAFVRAYKDPDTHCCLLVVSPEKTHFLYLPYPDQEE